MIHPNELCHQPLLSILPESVHTSEGPLKPSEELTITSDPLKLNKGGKKVPIHDPLKPKKGKYENIPRA